MYKSALIAAALLLAPSLHAKERKIIDPLAEAIVANNHVVAMEVRLAPTAVENMAKFEAKAAEKRAAANLPAINVATTQSAETPEGLSAVAGTSPVAQPSVASTGVIDVQKQHPSQDHYATLPFDKMFPLVMEDVTRAWGLTGGQPVKLIVTVDTVKTANAAMAWLAASSDQLAGMVEVVDPVTGAKLGSFYIDVINSHGGLLAMAMRGAGVREKLAEEFALQTSRVLTGRKSKTGKTKA